MYLRKSSKNRKNIAVLFLYCFALLLMGAMGWQCIENSFINYYPKAIIKDATKNIILHKTPELHKLTDLHTSKEGLDLIRRFEGLLEKDGDKFKSYLCPAGVWTICWGHTKGVTETTKVTLKECKKLFKRDILSSENIVKDNVKVTLTQGQFDAIVSFVFNVGPTNFRRSSVLKYINIESYNKVPERLSLWDNAYVEGELVPLKGLTLRRKAEGKMFSTS